ncbi:MAG: alpha/beta fold hydrolase [Rhodospirillales bacterium]
MPLPLPSAEKQPLVLLPGLLCDAALWRHQRDSLADLADITVADLTGHDTLGAMAEHVLASTPETFALAGLSMGGYLAQEIMRRAPERVTRLALLDTSFHPDTPELTARRRGLMDLSQKGEFKGVTARLLPLLIHQDRLEDAALTETVFAMADSVGKEAFLRQQHAIMSRPDGRKDLANIACPTLVLCGRQDALAPFEVHREMAALIPGAKFVAIEDCGHLSTLERPRAVSAVMRYWLQGGG